jgi:hypothetical protein
LLPEQIRAISSNRLISGYGHWPPRDLGLGPEVWRVLAKAHDLRNSGKYEGYFDIDERLVSDVAAACRIVADRLGTLPPP